MNWRYKIRDTIRILYSKFIIWGIQNESKTTNTQYIHLLANYFFNYLLLCYFSNKLTRNYRSNDILWYSPVWKENFEFSPNGKLGNNVLYITHKYPRVVERVKKKESCLVRSTSSIDFHASYLLLKLHKYTIQPVDRNSSNNSVIAGDTHFPRVIYVRNNFHSQVQRVVSWRSLGAGMLVSMQLQGFEERVSSRNGSMHRR